MVTSQHDHLDFPLPFSFQSNRYRSELIVPFLSRFESIAVPEIGECVYSCCGNKIKPFYKGPSLTAPNRSSGSA